MPAKNSNKIFVTDHFYHVYNRGVEKRNIFLDQNDYLFFLSLFNKYLSPINTIPTTQKEVRPLTSRTLTDQVSLQAYCLMPNHYHFLFKLLETKGITNLMRAINDSYVRYFNLRYERVGSLFQGKYKAVMIEDEPQLLQVSSYIHRNPKGGATSLKDYPYSSYEYYLKGLSLSWLKVEEILGYFNGNCSQDSQDILSYQNFVEKQSDELDKEPNANLFLDS